MCKLILISAAGALALGLCAEAAQAQSQGRDRDARDRDGVSVEDVVTVIGLGARLLGALDRDERDSRDYRNPRGEQEAAVDYYLEIDGVEGESSDDRRRGGVHVAAGDVNGDGRTDSRPAGGRDLDHSDGDETAGLLLPAVQRIREAAASEP